MDEQSGESKEEEVIGEGIGESEIFIYLFITIIYRNEVDEETNGVNSRDKVKHNRRSDRLVLERVMSVAEQE